MTALKYFILFSFVAVALATGDTASPTKVTSTTNNPKTDSSAIVSTTTSSPNTDTGKCQREDGDELLTNVSLIDIVVAGKPTLSRTYEGYKITCTRCYSILGGLQNLLNINVLNGGYQCDRVLLEVNVNLAGLLGSCEVYGRKLKDGETGDCSSGEATTVSSNPTNPSTISSIPTNPTTISIIPADSTTASSNPTTVSSISTDSPTTSSKPTTVSSILTDSTTVSSSTISTTTSASTTDSQKCQREDGDELLTDVSLLSIVVAGKPTLDKTYDGYKITCTKCYSILGGLQNLLKISVLNGGYQCDSVLLEVNINLGSLLGRCQVYGRKLKDGESSGC